jgi:ATP-dependent DNA ligase
MKDWLKRRNDIGAYETLLFELRHEDQSCFLNFLRVTPSIFDELLEKVTPFIEKRSTNFRQPIPPGLRLAITLRYLGTGKLNIITDNKLY